MRASARAAHGEREAAALRRLPRRVVIAGGGVTALEALIAIRSLAGGRVEPVLVAPDLEFTWRALSVEQPFGRGTLCRYRLSRIAADQGAELVTDRLVGVDTESREVTLATGRRRPYDMLLVAVGARPLQSLPGVAIFRGLQDAGVVRDVLRDAKCGAVSSLGLLIPLGTCWPLPLYELALLTAEWAKDAGVRLEQTLITPEEAPLAVFGSDAADAVRQALADAGIALQTGVAVAGVRDGAVVDAAGTIVLHADRQLAVPTLSGPWLRGLPSDGTGFLPVDGHCAVPGAPGVFAAGDATTLPVKQGGLAAQQADVAATAIAALAGAAVDDRVFEPVLRAKLLTGSRATYLRTALDGLPDDGTGEVARHALWWPPTKVAAPYLSAYLEQVDQCAVGVGEGRTRRPPSGSRRLLATGDPAGGIELLGR